MRHIPNILSFLRLVLVGLFVWLFLEGRYLPALSAFLFAFFTDVLDGELARRNGWISNLGKLLDPLADKIMTLAALICIYLGKREGVYLLLFAVMLVKELLMLVGGFLLAGRNIVVAASWPGKLATGLFAVGIVLTLVSFLPAQVEPWNKVILCAAAALSCYALVYYAATQGKTLFQKRA